MKKAAQQFLSAIGETGGRARIGRLSRKACSALARKAARARWAKARARKGKARSS